MSSIQEIWQRKNDTRARRRANRAVDRETRMLGLIAEWCILWGKNIEDRLSSMEQSRMRQLEATLLDMYRHPPKSELVKKSLDSFLAECQAMVKTVEEENSCQ